MSFLKSKHSGWTHELKRTPFGGGGGWNPISAVTDTISSALGTDGGGGGILGGLASIDPGPAIGGALANVDPGPSIGQMLAGVDKFVGNEIPGGWATVGALGAGGLGYVFAPEIAAALEAAGMSSEAAALTPEMVNFANASADPIATIGAISGMSPTEFAALTNAAATAGLEGASLTPEMIAYANASADPIGSINAIAGLTPEEFASYTQIIGGPSQAAGLTAGEDLAQLMQSHPNLSAAQLEDILAINYGTDPLLSADAANLAAQGYDAATINQILGYSYTPAELAGTGIESFAADSAAGLNAKDVLKNINRARQLANLVSSAGGAVKAAKIPTSAEWLKNAQQVGLNMPAQQQFGGLYEMNKSPFTFQNPLANALKAKDTTGYDVSGTTGQALNTDQQNKIYASLLRS